MLQIPFTENVLQSRVNFEQYLAGEATIARIKKEAKKPYMPGEDRLSAIHVAWVTATTPLRMGYFLFLWAAATPLFYAGARKIGMELYVESERQLTYNSMVLLNYLIGPYRNVLVDVMNTYSFDAHEFYSHPNIDLAKVDTEVFANLHTSYINTKNQIVFDRLGGECTGICDWTAHLYFQTKEAFSNPEHHLAAVIKQVSEGAGREAALWQITVDSPPLLGLQKKYLAEWQSPSAVKVQKLFNALTPGLYCVSTATHRMNFAVTDQHTYLIDPNCGLVKDPEQIVRQLCRNSVLKVCELSV